MKKGCIGSHTYIKKMFGKNRHILINDGPDYDVARNIERAEGERDYTKTNEAFDQFAKLIDNNKRRVKHK